MHGEEIKEELEEEMKRKVRKEAEKCFEKDLVSFFYELFPLSKKKEIVYKDFKDLGTILGKVIVTQGNLQEWFEITRKEAGEIWKKAIDEALGNSK